MSEFGEGGDRPPAEGKPIGKAALSEALRQFIATRVRPGEKRFLQVEPGITVVGTKKEQPEGDGTPPEITQSMTILHPPKTPTPDKSN